MNSPAIFFGVIRGFDTTVAVRDGKAGSKCPLIIECGVGYKVVSKKVCLILRRSKSFGSMKERRNGGLVAVKYLPLEARSGI